MNHGISSGFLSNKVIASDEFIRKIDRHLKSLSPIQYSGVEMAFALWHEEIFRLQKSNPELTILVDHYFTFSEAFTNMLHVWNKNKRQNLLFVKLFCAQQVAQDRLIKRNLSLDSSQHRHEFTVKGHFHPATLARVHGNKCYDLEVDTSGITAVEAAEQITTRLSNTAPFTGFIKSFDIHAQAIQQNFNHAYDSVIDKFAARMAVEYHKNNSADLWKIVGLKIHD